MSYYFSKTLSMDFETAIQTVSLALQEHGFGIVSEIDLQSTFKKKLNQDFRPYRILGACNPSYAYEALQRENKIGTMLPCNVLVQEIAPGQVEVSAVDPVASMTAIDNPELKMLAKEVGTALQKMVEDLA
ncbi:MAG: DUF302 domain-containing protein [Haliscomenobacter sp.]|nr:DUF302 domain-containing protein [Haliscomenobacter sp.]MBP9078569.1 DUF302 domain-containing protein [Haliscomenobacter sp.]